MAKQRLNEEQRKAIGERLRKAREAKKAKLESELEIEPETTPESEQSKLESESVKKEVKETPKKEENAWIGKHKMDREITG